jgi:orotate phosphoribosyltransferase
LRHGESATPQAAVEVSMSQQSRSRLLELFKTRAFSFGRFTLASGKESSYYVNSKKAIFNGEAVALLGEVLYDLTKDLDIQAVGGLEVGAIPIAVAVALRYHQAGRPIEGFFVRKQIKGHGSQERVEGVLRPGDRALVVEDVVTTGESVLQAVQEVEKAGAMVVAVSCLVDRLEGGAEHLGKYNFRPVFTIRDFGVEPPHG